MGKICGARLHEVGQMPLLISTFSKNLYSLLAIIHQIQAGATDRVARCFVLLFRGSGVQLKSPPRLRLTFANNFDKANIN